MNEHPLQDVLATAEVSPSHSSGLATAFYDHLEEQRFREEALELGLDPADLQPPQGSTEEKLDLFARANPDLDLRHPPKGSYPLAVGVLKMLAAPPEE